jgi:nucleotide sugar dehydrogenase
VTGLVPPEQAPAAQAAQAPTASAEGAPARPISPATVTTAGSITVSVDLVVIGLGYVGLPLAQEATRSGLTVVGLDVSTRIVDGLTAGHSHVDDLSDDDVAAMLTAGFRATTDASVIAGADTVVICVPTPLGTEGGPDLAYVLTSTRTIAANLKPGTLVVLESTTYPGTTDEQVRPILEEATRLVAGTDFNLAFSPERIDPGNPVYGMKNTPKVVGGHTAACTVRAAEFYRRFVDTVVEAKGTREAEMAKLLENTYRQVNIGLMNEMAQFCHELEIDLWDVIEAAKSKPFGFQAFYPGPGVGGHCIPIDPMYLSYQVRARLGAPSQFIEIAQAVNNGMPKYVARRTQDLLNTVGKPMKGSTVLVLGVTYKADIADQRESPAEPLAVHLASMGATVAFFDPYVEAWHVPGVDTVKVHDLEAGLAACDIAILVQSHAVLDLGVVAAHAPLLLDTRGKASGPQVERL